MATKNRTELKSYFETGKRPTQDEFEDLIVSQLNIEEDKASEADAQNDQIDNKYLTPKTAKQNVITFAPVKKVNNIAPDSNGNISITNVSGTASTITGSISKSQVTGLESDLNGKQNILTSGTTIKTINGQTVLGSGDIPITGAAPVKLMAVLSSPFPLINSNVEQNAFPPSCNKFTLSSNKTYFFKGKFLISNGSTSHTTALNWIASPELVLSSMEYVVKTFSSGPNNIISTSFNIQISGIDSRVLNSASTATTKTIEFEGIIRCTIGGFLTPQIKFSVAPGVNINNAMKLGSFIEFTEIGNETVQTVGNVS